MRPVLAAKHLTATISEPRRSSDAQQRRPTGEAQGASKRPKLEPPATNGHVPGPQQPQPQPLQPKQEPADQQQPAGQVRCPRQQLSRAVQSAAFSCCLQGYSTVGVCR